MKGKEKFDLSRPFFSILIFHGNKPFQSEVYSLSNGFLRHHFFFSVRTGIIIWEIVVFLCFYVFQEIEPAVTSNASTLGLRVTLTSSILMERAERNLLKSSVT